MSESTITPLQAAINEMEDARIKLLHELTDQETAIKNSIAELTQEIRNQNSRRVDLIKNFYYKDAQKVSEIINEVQAKIKGLDLEAANLQIRLKSAREGGAPELSAFALRVNCEMDKQRKLTMCGAEDVLRSFVTDEMRNAVQSLVSATNPNHVKRVILELCGLKA